MPVNGQNFHLTHYACRVDYNGEKYLISNAYTSHIEDKKETIINDLYNHINNYVSELGLIAIINEEKSKDEDNKIVEIYEYRDGYSVEDYINKGNKYGYGWIENKII